jgi:hypothetical protein
MLSNLIVRGAAFTDLLGTVYKREDGWASLVVVVVVVV